MAAVSVESVRMTLHAGARLQRFAKHVCSASGQLHHQVLRAKLNRSYSKLGTRVLLQCTSHSGSGTMVKLVPNVALSRTHLPMAMLHLPSSAYFVPVCICRPERRFICQEAVALRNCFQNGLLMTMPHAAPYSSKSYQENTGRSDDIIAFIETEEDFQLFLRQLKNALNLDENPQTSASPLTNLALLVQKLVALNCEPRNIASMILANPSILKVNSPKLLQTIDFLQELGLNWRRLMKVLDQNPSLWTGSVQHLQARVAYLRKLGFVEGSLQKAIADWAEILTINTNKIKAVVQVLMKKCGFSKTDMLTILSDSPAVLAEDLESIGNLLIICH